FRTIIGFKNDAQDYDVTGKAYLFDEQGNEVGRACCRFEPGRYTLRWTPGPKGAWEIEEPVEIPDSDLYEHSLGPGRSISLYTGCRLAQLELDHVGRDNTWYPRSCHHHDGEVMTPEAAAESSCPTERRMSALCRFVLPDEDATYIVYRRSWLNKAERTPLGCI